MTLKNLQNSVSAHDKKDGGYLKTFVDILQNVVVDISAVKFSVSSVLPNKKRFICLFVQYITKLSKDNTIRDMIIKKVYIFCKTVPSVLQGTRRQ